MNPESINKIDVRTISAAIAIGFLGCFLISSDQHLLFCALVAGGIVLLSIRGGVQNQLPIFTRMRKASTVIYLTHMVFRSRAECWCKGRFLGRRKQEAVIA